MLKNSHLQFDQDDGRPDKINLQTWSKHVPIVAIVAIVAIIAKLTNVGIGALRCSSRRPTGAGGSGPAPQTASGCQLRAPNTPNRIGRCNYPTCTEMIR